MYNFYYFIFLIVENHSLTPVNISSSSQLPVISNLLKLYKVLLQYVGDKVDNLLRYNLDKMFIEMINSLLQIISTNKLKNSLYLNNELIKEYCEILLIIPIVYKYIIIIFNSLLIRMEQMAHFFYQLSIIYRLFPL